MRIALIGMGRMGRMIRDCAADRGIEVAAEFNTATIAQLAQCDRMDAVIDFSAPASLPALAAYVQRTGTPLVSGTTGYCDEEAARVNALGSYAPVALSANFSIGVAVLKHLAAEAAALLPDFDIEIIETHHRMKKMRRAARRSSFFQPSTPTAPIRRSSAAKDSRPAQPVKSVSTLSAAAPWRACIPCPSSATKKSSHSPTARNPAGSLQLARLKPPKSSRTPPWVCTPLTNCFSLAAECCTSTF